MEIQEANVFLASKRAYSERLYRKETLRAWVDERRPNSGVRAAGAGQAGDSVALSPEAGSLLSPGPSPSLSSASSKKTAATASEENENAVTGNPETDMMVLILERLLGVKVKLLHLESTGESSSATQPAVEMGEAPETLAGWGVEYEAQESYHESEQTGFTASGTIVTTDGREIKFALELQMRREFAQESSVSMRFGDAAKVDPLVLNLNGGAVSLTESKFAFDLNADGVMESVSFIAPGSGFLALDRNGDGRINDGNELFGPRSGDGFAELAAYDEDGNGWIDEGDAISGRLLVWTRDNSGTNQLRSLKQAEVGAIYLDKMASQFSLKDRGNGLLGEVASTGMFVKENGTVGSVQQVNLAV